MSKDTYSSRTLCGNWFEDTKGATLAKEVDAAPAPKWGISETMSHFGGPARLGPPGGSAPISIDTLDGHLLTAHAPTAADLVARVDHPTRFVSMANADARGTSVADSLAGRSDAPASLARTSLIHAQAFEVREDRMQSLCASRVVARHSSLRPF